MKSSVKPFLFAASILALGWQLVSCGPSTLGPSTPGPISTAPISTLTVNSNYDDDNGYCDAQGCTLREAINKANTMSGTITIKFNIGGGGPRTIMLHSALPAVTVPVVIDGTTQPGYASGPLIEIDGSTAGTVAIDGLRLEGGGSTVKGLVINRFSGNGIRISAPGGNKIYSNYIGTDITGMIAMGNENNGVLVDGDGNHIGGDKSPYQGSPPLGWGNVISGNLWSGVVINSGGKNYVQGNLIGLDVTGTTPLGNHGNGVLVNADLVQIGGTVSGLRNIIADNWIDGVRIVGGWTDQIQGNYIGTDVTGSIDLGNHENGVNLVSSDTILVGGSGPGARNVISGNQLLGLLIDKDSTGVEVYGNYIGTNAAGSAALKNVKSGIRVSGNNHQIGSIDLDTQNVISGNGGAGISVVAPATIIKIQNNFIGTSADGESAVGNDIGVEIGLTSGAYSVLIGGSVYGEGNLVSGNNGEGLLLYNHAQVAGNRIGMDQSGLNELPNGGDGILIKGDNNRIGTPQYPNSIAHNGGHGVAVITESGSAGNNTLSGNNIWDNGKLGIAMGGDSVLANDPGDADTGDNNLQNYPVMVSAIHDPVAGQTTVTATIDSAPQTLFFVEFFVNTACDPTGYGEGEQMAASKIVTTNAGGHADVTGIYEPYHFIAGSFITATATDSAGNTSEFSNCIPVTQATVPTATIAPTLTPTSSGMQFKPSANPGAFFFGDCTPNQVQLGVEAVNPPEPVDYMLLFVRLVDQKSGAAGAWSEGLSMSKLDPTKFLFNLTLDKVPDYDKFADAWLQYQFVAYSKTQKEIGRSEVFWDVSFGRCGGTGVTPTSTPRGPHTGP